MPAPSTTTRTPSIAEEAAEALNDMAQRLTMIARSVQPGLLGLNERDVNRIKMTLRNEAELAHERYLDDMSTPHIWRDAAAHTLDTLRKIDRDWADAYEQYHGRPYSWSNRPGASTCGCQNKVAREKAQRKAWYALTAEQRAAYEAEAGVR